MASGFRRIIAARKGLEVDEKELRDAVAAARAAGDSWTVIGGRDGDHEAGGVPAVRWRYRPLGARLTDEADPTALRSRNGHNSPTGFGFRTMRQSPTRSPSVPSLWGG